MTDPKICDLVSSRIRVTDQVLDIGCGEGYLCNCIANKLQKPVVGLDISNKGFKKAHTESCEGFGTCDLIECLVGKAENLVEIVADRKFNVATLIHSFHHLDDIQQAINQTKEVLTQNGKIIIAEYSQEKGSREDTCERYTIEFITNALLDKFTKITIEQPENGFFLITAEI